MSLFKGSISGNRVARKLVIGAGWGGWGRIRGWGRLGVERLVGGWGVHLCPAKGSSGERRIPKRCEAGCFKVMSLHL